MKTTSLPSVEQVYETTLTKEDNVSIPNLLTQERNQAYTSLVEGIEEVRELMSSSHVPVIERVAFYAACNEMETRIKTLYNKE